MSALEPSPNGWWWLLFDSDTKSVIGHAVHDSTVTAVIADLVARGCGEPRLQHLPKMSIDMPGMVSTKRPWEEFVLDGLPIDIPSEDVASFVLMLQEAPLRKGDYYKIHGFYRALVLSRVQFDALLALLMARLPTAEARAQEFYAVTPSASEVLREIAAKTSGIPIEKVPDLGGHKNDRHRPRTRGQA